MVPLFEVSNGLTQLDIDRAITDQHVELAQPT